MAIQDRTTLKTYFETYDKPTESQFADLIDSMVLKGTDSFIGEATVPYNGDQELTPTATSGDNATTGLTLTQRPIADTRIDVFINGENINVGDGIKTADCYFSRDSGVTALTLTNILNGDTLYYNGAICHIGNLDTNDRIDINYHYMKPIAFTIQDLPEIQSHWLMVDAVNGEDSTGLRGSTSKRFSTIKGAENAASSGDVIWIVTDIMECNMGKDGLKYVIQKGCKIWFDVNEATPTGLATAHLWTDYKATGPISYEVYGGIHETEGNWFGPSDRGIIRNVQSGTSIRIFDAEQVNCKGTSVDVMTPKGTGSTIEIYCNGDIISGLHGIQVGGAIDGNFALVAKGRIEAAWRLVANYDATGGKNKVNIISDTEIRYVGHAFNNIRAMFYTNMGNSGKSHWSIQAPKIVYYDELPINGSNNGALIFGWDRSNVRMDFKADIISMSHTDPATYTNEAGLLGLNRTSNGAEYEINFDVKLVLLGKGHELDDSYSSLNRDNAIVNWYNTEIVTLTDVAESQSVFEGNYIKHVFNGTIKVILNPTAITAGQKAIGGSGANNFWISGKFISNGQSYDNTLEEVFSGNTVTDVNGTGVDNLLLNSNFGNILDWNKYQDLILTT